MEREMVTGFKKGCITRLFLENFMTYDQVECTPSPYFNIIIGPNGSGKSSIVCGICLGLGGKTAILGRASNPCDYIKHGHQSCRIEIELYHSINTKKLIVREIYDNNASKFWVDGVSFTKKQVDDLVKSLGIQMENLCQFLPQDKVAEFTRMNPHDLLINTQKATGDVEMVGLFDEMITHKSQMKDMEKEIKSETAHLEKESSKNVRMDEELKSYKDRQNLLNQIDTLNKKLSWMRVVESWLTNTKDKKKVDSLSLDIQVRSKKLMATTSEIQEVRSQLNASKNVLQRKRENFRKLNHLLSDSLRKFHGVRHELQSIDQKHRMKYEAFMEYKSMIHNIDAEIDDLLKQIKELPPDFADSLDKDQKSKTSEIDKVCQERARLSSKLDQNKSDMKACEIEINNTSNNLDRHKNQIYSKLRSLSKDTHTAMCWIKENTHMFKGKIYDPMMTQIKVTSSEYVKYVEGRISYFDLLAFTCESKEDVCLLSNVLLDEKKLRVNIVHSTVSHQPYSPRVPIEQIRHLGFKCYLKDVVDAPPAIMDYLCKNYKFHDVPIGTERTHNMMDDIEASKITDYYSDSSHFKVGKSLYSVNTFSKVVELKPPNILVYQCDSKSEQSMKQKLKNLEDQKARLLSDMDSNKTTIHKIEKQLEVLRTELFHIKEKREYRDTLDLRLKDKCNQKKRREAEMEAYATTEDEPLQTKQNLLRQTMTNFVNHTETMLGLPKIICDIEASESQLKILDKIYLDKQKEKCLLVDEKDLVEEHLNNAIQKEKESLALHQECIKSFQLFCNARFKLSKTGPQLDNAALKEEFSSLSGSVTEIEDQISAHKAHLACFPDVDKRAIEEYLKKKKELEELKVKLAAKIDKKNQLEIAIDELEDRWSPKVKKLIEHVNKNFGNFFQSLNCVGEVCLYVDAERDYSKYGIVIKVKFRSEDQLQELSSYHQSGGERSVGTILYMMAIQGLTEVPFRVLDEINQGMDHINERKVFKLIVDTASNTSSQYFLLSPKLLPDLEYGTRCKPHLVYNSRDEHSIGSFKWDISAFIKRRSRF